MKFGKRKETNYFEILHNMAQCAHKAAIQLDELMHNYTDVAKKLKIYILQSTRPTVCSMFWYVHLMQRL